MSKFIIRATLLCSLVAAGQAQAQTGIWISKAKIATLPTSGAPWTYVKSQADATCPAMNLADLTNYTDQCAAAKALVFARLEDESYRTTVEALIQQVTNYTNSTFLSQGGRCLELGRNVGQYAIAADLIDLKNHNPSLDTAFRAKLVEMLTWTTNQNGTLMQCSDEPTNWGTQALHSRVAIDLYVGNSVAGYDGVADLATAANIFRGYLGDYNTYHNFNYAHLEAGSADGFAVISWYQDPWEGLTVANGAQPTPIANTGTTIVCQPGWNTWGTNSLDLCTPGTVFDLDGRVFDVYRGGHFKLLPIGSGSQGCIDNSGGAVAGNYNGPCYTDYPIAAMQGYIATAEMLYQNGYDTYNWSNQAVRRSTEFLKRLNAAYNNTSWFGTFENSGIATWIGYLVNARYGLTLPVSGTARAIGNGTMGWTDWTTIGDSPVSSVPVSISPTSATVTSGGTLQFMATVSGTTNTAVTWSASAGSVSSGLYTAPTVTANSTATVTATSVADPTKSASATVSITAPPTVVAISISPTSATVASGGTQQFTAQVSNTTNTAVTWSASAGSISSGLYTAPTVTANSTATVTVTSQADTTKSASATVTITPPNAITVSVTPASVTLASGATQQFTATITNATTNTGVNWSSTIGTISSTGLFTAPVVTQTTIGTVKATSVQDPTKFGTATITITPPATLAVTISPTSATVASGGTQQFSDSVTGTTNTAVTWSASTGTVSTSGLYTPPTVSVNTTATVKATSVADSTKSATASITLTPPPPPIAVSISPISAAVVSAGTQQFTASVTGTTQTAVTWSADAGTVSSSGLYTAPAVTANSTAKVTVTSVADPTKSASATVSITGVSSPLENPPSCSLSVSPVTGSAPLFVTAKASCSGTGIMVVLNWGDGTVQNGTGGTYTYRKSASYAITVTATDSAGQTGGASQTVNVAKHHPK